MRHAFLAALTAPLALWALPAAAADLPYRQSAPADYYTPAPVARWQGFYAGLNAGYGWSSFTDSGDWLLGSPTGGQFGFTGGYNYMVAPNFVIGAEADFDFANINLSGYAYPGISTSASVNDLFTLRGRVGYVMDRALFFVSGGLAGGNTNINLQNVWGRFWGQDSTYQLGWALGAGAEYLVVPNVSVKAEYLFTSLGSNTYFNFSPYAVQTGTNTSQVRVGVNYHF